MKFDTRKTEDTDLDALIARIYDAPDAAARDAARVALRGANPGTIADDLAAAIGSMLIVPRSEGPPTRPAVGSSRTAAAHQIAVVLRALDDIQAAADRELARAEQAAQQLPALVAFQRIPDNNRDQFIEVVDNFAHNVDSRAQRTARQREGLEALHDRFRADLALLLDNLP